MGTSLYCNASTPPGFVIWTAFIVDIVLNPIEEYGERCLLMVINRRDIRRKSGRGRSHHQMAQHQSRDTQKLLDFQQYTLMSMI